MHFFFILFNIDLTSFFNQSNSEYWIQQMHEIDTLSVCLSLSPLLFEYEIAHEESISPSTGNILQGQPLEFSLKNHFQCIYLSKYG